MTMTAQETADSLAEMTGAFERRRDAILAALLAERKAALAEAARVILSYGCSAHDCPVGANILSLSPEGKGPDDWRTMDSAPKDGTWFEACRGPAKVGR
jgi:hypothetical protein